MSFQILVETDNRMFVGIGPFSMQDEIDVQPDYFVAAINDDDTQQIIIDNIYVRLEPDGQTLTPLDSWPE